MSYRDTVLYIAYQELAMPVHWRAHEARILDYFLISSGVKYTKQYAVEVSWCSYFVHWCLFKAGVSPLPQVGTAGTLGKMGSIGRFIKGQGGVYDGYLVREKNYKPRPGDMYYRPIPNDHIGFISDVRDAGNGMYEIRSIDGNSGPMGASKFFDMEYGDKIGKGFIYQPDEWRKLPDNCKYVKLCDDD